ncbi:MAG TPA: c-type cytochrome [Myxococcota bacterium]|nr:c-type cytochrome [Myxococcota bacterium]
MMMLAALLTVLGCGETPTPGLSYGEELFETCVPCHGPAGLGKPSLEAPAIAGLEQWYIERQLLKFQDGRRGSHPNDLEGLRMRSMARTLEHEGDIESVAEYASKLPHVDAGTTIAGDAERGESTFIACAACHAADGTGNEALGAPSLVGLDDWYVVAQLEKFASGVRGGNPDDLQGVQMRPMAIALDEQARHDLAAHLQTLR